MTAVIFFIYRRKCGSEATTSTVWKVLTVGNSVRLPVVTTTRLVNTDGGNSAWTKNTSYGSTTTSHGQSEAVRKGLASLHRVELQSSSVSQAKPRELYKRLDAVVQTTVFPSALESAHSASNSSTLIALNAPSKAHKDGVPSNGNNLSHGTSPQVSSTGRRLV
ncbi:hypothetical protein Taro_039377 [Colocasia esculenta]|uniref:Uncharacterized protein n=1 Tax=Colocasia esculenta TaxID=4460 RepID=A0A843W696_COLES|nr:hypothetical protein [Colocasia esculenta]